MNIDNDALGISPAPGEVRLERWLPGPVERIWAYLTDSRKRGLWLAPGEMELKAGCRVEHRFRHADLSHETQPPKKYGAYESGHVLRGTGLDCEPPRLLRYTWGDGEEDSQVTFELFPAEDGEVKRVVTQRRLRGRDGMASVAAGWHTHLGILLDRLEEREPRGFWSTHGRIEGGYAEIFAAAPTAGATAH